MAESFDILVKRTDYKKIHCYFAIETNDTIWQMEMSLFSIGVNVYKYIIMLPNLIV